VCEVYINIFTANLIYIDINTMQLKIHFKGTKYIVLTEIYELQLAYNLLKFQREIVTQNILIIENDGSFKSSEETDAFILRC
jgi:hypothetical protein